MENTPERRLAKIRHLALDLDGTVYRGGTLFASTVPFLEAVSKLGIGYTFVTNNSSRSARDYVSHLRRLGLPIEFRHVRTSGQAAVEFLRSDYPAARRLSVLGTQSLRDEFCEAGYSVVEGTDKGPPDVVVIGFDPDLSFERLCTTAYWIAQGKPFVATHPDLQCPTDRRTVLVDCGGICACLEKVTGRPPDAVLGKPDPRMLRSILQHHELSSDELAVVGDRLYTDMAMARSADAVGVLVLTGETTAAQAGESSLPELVVEDLEQLGRLLSRCGNSKRLDDAG